MKWFKDDSKTLVQSEKGQSVIEYVLLVVVILLATVTLVPQIGTAIKSKLQDIIDKLNAVTVPDPGI